MLLGPVSSLDIIVFFLFLIFHLLWGVPLFRTISCGVHALPFLLLELPTQLVRERWLTPPEKQQPFTKRATIFQDVVIRCVRWAFVNLPNDVARIFFSRGVARPFLRFRMLRSGYLVPGKGCPNWMEVEQDGAKGLWIAHDLAARPDVVVYYCHGGGFTLGSTYFYQEFLMTWVSVLRDHGFKNPAVFALEYTLVPEKTYPHQLQETLAGYAYVLSRTFGSRRVVVSGDSAGGMLVLSMLLHLGSTKEEAQRERPEYAALISPWTHLVSRDNKGTVSDFLDMDRLNGHGRQYAGTRNPEDPAVSPGDCLDMKLWTDSMPRSGMGFYYGSEELFRTNIEVLTKRLGAVGKVVCREDESVHVWPVAAMFLESDVRKRRGGLDKISHDIANAVLRKRVRYCKSDSTVHALHDASPYG